MPQKLQKFIFFTKRFLAAFQKRWKVFWLRVSPVQGVIEGWVLVFVILLLAIDAGNALTSYTLSNILFCASCAAGVWPALRIRLAQGKRWTGVVWEEGWTGAAISALTLIGVMTPFWLVLNSRVFTQNALGPLGTVILLGGAGFAYYVARISIWVLTYWNHLRRHSLMWALTHAHLVVVIIAAVCFVALLMTYTLSETGIPEVYADMSPLQRFVSQLLTSVLPMVGVSLIVLIILLAVLLPPLALFSFLFARQTTQRLQKVVWAAQRFRSGDYAARVRVEGEDEVAQLQSDFNGMAETLEKTLDELKAEREQVQNLLQARRELIASVSHELRTPLATLRGYLDAAIDKDLDSGTEAGDENSNPIKTAPPAPGTSASITPASGAPAVDMRMDLEIMRREAIRLQSLIDDLFTLSRAEIDRLPLELGPVNLDELIRNRVAAIAPLAWQTGRVEVLSEVEPNLPPAQADPTRLEQVLVNLLRNALRYTPPGGIVVVIAAQAGSELRVDVRDTGAGISAEELPHVWERFYRGSANGGTGAETSSGAGAGLGLALVKELTEAMGGRVSLESKAGEGSCFSLYLSPSCDNFATKV